MQFGFFLKRFVPGGQQSSRVSARVTVIPGSGVSERQFVDVVKAAGVQPGGPFQVWKPFLGLFLIDQPLTQTVICIKVLRLVSSGVTQRFFRRSAGGVCRGTGVRLFAERSSFLGQRFSVSHNRIGTMTAETGGIGNTRHGEVRFVEELRPRLRRILRRGCL